MSYYKVVTTPVRFGLNDPDENRRFRYSLAVPKSLRFRYEIGEWSTCPIGHFLIFNDVIAAKSFSKGISYTEVWEVAVRSAVREVWWLPWIFERNWPFPKVEEIVSAFWTEDRFETPLPLFDNNGLSFSRRLGVPVFNTPRGTVGVKKLKLVKEVQ